MSRTSAISLQSATVLMHLVPLHSPRHLSQLRVQTTLNQSLAYTFQISVTAVTYLRIDQGFPPLLFGSAGCSRPCPLTLPTPSLAPSSPSPRLFRLRTSYPLPPSSFEAVMQSAHATHYDPSNDLFLKILILSMGSLLEFLYPSTGRHVPCQLRLRPHCPPNALGYELHVILACPNCEFWRCPPSSPATPSPVPRSQPPNRSPS